MFSRSEFDTAFAKTQRNHPTVSRALGESVMKKFVERWEGNKQKPSYAQETFKELIRLTLNEMKIGKPARQMYAALIGFYYTQHAAHANRRKAGTKATAGVPQKITRPIATVMEDGGQIAWRI